MIVGDNKITIASITDGTSNTFMLGETAIGILSTNPSYYLSQAQARWWQIGFWYSGEFDCEYPINAYKRIPYQSFPMGLNTNGDWATAEGASSFHPGGCNFAFCDGSVKFIKESIASWTPYNTATGDPVGFTYGSCGEDYIGTAVPRFTRSSVPATAVKSSVPTPTDTHERAALSVSLDRDRTGGATSAPPFSPSRNPVTEDFDQDCRPPSAEKGNEPGPERTSALSYATPVPGCSLDGLRG